MDAFNREDACEVCGRIRLAGSCYGCRISAILPCMATGAGRGADTYNPAGVFVPHSKYMVNALDAVTLWIRQNTASNADVDALLPVLSSGCNIWLPLFRTGRIVVRVCAVICRVHFVVRSDASS